MIDDNKVYFLPGDLVEIKLDIPNKPIMMVYRIERSLIRTKDNKDNTLRGVKVRWFTENGFLQEAIFSTKDLLKV